MDLEKLNTAKASNAGFELQLRDPATNDDLQIFITVLGRDSTEFRRVSSDQNKKRVQRASRGGRFSMPTLGLEELERDTSDLLAACTKSWREVEKKDGKDVEKHTLTVGGAELECNTENARRIYNEYGWMREQVDQAVADRANFLKR